MFLKRPKYLKNYFLSYILLLSLPILPFIQNAKITWIVHFILIFVIIFEKKSVAFSRYPFLILLTLVPVIWSFLFTLEGEYYHIVQSLFYLLTPYIMIVLGVQFGGLIQSKKNLYLYIIYSGTLGALIFLLKGIILLGDSAFTDIYNFKSKMLWTSITNVMALILLLFSKRYNVHIIKKKSIHRILVTINFLGLIATASRTYYIIFLIFILIILYDYRKTVFIYCTIFFGVLILLLINLKTDNLLIVKIQNSFEEISNPRQFSGYDDANSFYRAYETQKAIKTYNSGTESQLLFGHGLQKAVDLDIYVELAGAYRRYIPVLHNGFAYMLLRTGVLGCFIFFIFFIISFFIRNKNNHDKFFHLLYLGVLISLIVSNYVVATFYTTEMTFNWIFIGIYFLMSSSKKQNEN